MTDINDLPSRPVRNSRVNSIDTLIAQTNTNVTSALDRIISIMNNPNAKDSDILNASKAYIQFYILFRDKKEDWEDRKLKRELLQLNIKRSKAESNPKNEQLMGFSTEYDGSNDGFLTTVGNS